MLSSLDGWAFLVERRTVTVERLARRLDALEALCRAAEGRITAQEIVLDYVVRALVSADRGSGRALVLALEVVEADRADCHGEDDETVQALRRARERLRIALGVSGADG